MANFQIVSTGQDYRLEPLTDMACSLAAHCRRHGDSLVYPTAAAASEAARYMEHAIVNRRGRPWAIIK